MNRPPPVWTCRDEPVPGRLSSAAPFVAAPILRKWPAVDAGTTPPQLRRRSKIWDFDASLHCSIIGTCLSTGELRQVLGKLGLAPQDATDHELHHTAVSLACRHDPATKLLNKALDQRHRLVINQFSRANSEGEVRALWRAAVGRGDIPGAYWAALTHPATGHALIRETFGEVHMLSHLVGAANRADIRRLRELEQQQTALQESLARQQMAFHQAVVARDGRIRELEQAVLDRARSTDAEDFREDHSNAISALLVTLEKRLSAEIARRTAAEEHLRRARTTLQEERAGRRAAEEAKYLLSAELDALERTAQEAGRDNLSPTAGRQMDGETFLYVGGRAGQVAHLRQAVERRVATFLHHDGGREQHPDSLAGLVSRADLVVFPVDCVSHDAALNIKRLCRLAQKPYIPLRVASLACLLLALQRVAGKRCLPEAAE